jgi:hypothetical protein
MKNDVQNQRCVRSLDFNFGVEDRGRMCYSLLRYFLYARVARDLSSVLTVAAWAFEERKVLRGGIGFSHVANVLRRLVCIMLDISNPRPQESLSSHPTYAALLISAPSHKLQA